MATKYRYTLEALWVARGAGMPTCYGQTPKKTHQAILVRKRCDQDRKKTQDRDAAFNRSLMDKAVALQSKVQTLQRDLAMQRAKPWGDDVDAEAWVLMAMALHGKHDPIQACQAMEGLADVTPREIAAAVRLCPHIKNWLEAFPVGPDGHRYAAKKRMP
jgi:hypothetical protein